MLPANLEALVIKETLSLISEESFSSSSSDMFVGREQETKQLFQALQNSIIKNETGQQSNLVRLLGASGTGKTYTTLQILTLIDQNPQLKQFMAPWWNAKCAVINGALIHTCVELLNALLNILLPEDKRSFVINTLKTLGLNESLQAMKQLRLQYILQNPQKHHVIVVIDEEDQLVPSQQKSHTQKLKAKTEGINNVLTAVTTMAGEGLLNVIFVSNIVRTCQRLTRKAEKNPSSCIIFKPYTEDQLKVILDCRITLAKYNVLAKISKNNFYANDNSDFVKLPEPFSNSAKSFILKRVSSHQGDCRQMLEICRQLILEKLVGCSNDTNNIVNVVDSQPNKDLFSYSNKQLVQRNVDKFSEISKGSNSSICSETTAASSPRFVDYVKYNSNNNLKCIEFTETTQFLNQKCHYKKSKTYYSKLLMTLPLHQQILLCVLCITAKQLETSSDKEPYTKNLKQFSLFKIITLQKVYKSLCMQHQLPLQFRSQNDFIEGLTYLETTGIIKIHTKRRQSNAFQRTNFSSSSTDAEIELLLDSEDTLSVLRETKKFFDGLLE